MKMNKPPIPNEIFDWMEKIPFHALTPDQQKRVCEFFPEDEYDSMHVAASELRDAAMASRPKGKDRIREELLRVFEEKHGPANTLIILLNRPVRFWTAAAITLLLLTGLLWQRFSPSNQPLQVELPGRIDTVLVETMPAPVVVHDTVYLPYTPKKRRDHSYPSLGIKPEEQELYISSTKDLTAPINQPKKLSMEEDSLIGKYGFVSM